LSKKGFRSLVYIIIKPPFINEHQALREATNSIEYAFKSGASVVSLEPIGVGPASITELMYKDGAFKPAWLWTVVECVKACYLLGEIRVGRYQFSLRATTFSSHCEFYNEKVINALENWNRSYDINYILDLDCQCYNDYKNELSLLEENINSLNLIQKIYSFSKK
jgi:archaeosine synthase beta-subunit